MARRPRLEIAGGMWHVGSRGAVKQDIFRSLQDREWFLGRLAEVRDRMGWLLHAYCLMGHHFHLVVETPEPNLGRGMQLLKGPYAIRFNRQYGGSGHVFEDRFWNGLREGQWRYEDVMAYVALNPVNDGFCLDPANYRWSSFASVTRGLPCIVDLQRVLEFFEDRGRSPLDAYQACVYGRLAEPARAA
jgi:putative transposase